MSRSFTILKVEKLSGGTVKYYDGRFLGESASQVARKMFSKAYAECSGKCNSMKITLQETTSGSKKNKYAYRVTRKPQNTVVERDGQDIVYSFTTKVKSLNKNK